MIEYEVNPPKGERLTRLEINRMRDKAPSLSWVTTHADGSVVVEVADLDADALTDHLEALRIDYRML